MINGTFTIDNLGVYRTILEIKNDTLIAKWIYSWNIWIITALVILLLIWNILITWELLDLRKLKERQA